jgi:hypothetical protein
MFSLIRKVKNAQSKFFLSKNEKEYIEFNKKSFPKLNQGKTNGCILVELFDYPTLIYFWSIITNLIAKKNNLTINFYYFKTYSSIISNFKIFIKNLSKIYNSFNVNEGINFYNFNSENKKFNYTLFEKIKTKKQLVEFTYKSIKIGDLIYDTYIRKTFNPTINLNDPLLLKIFSEAITIFEQSLKYFLNNKIKLLITSHSYYTQYGIILRIAIQLNVPVLMVHSKARGNVDFRIKLIDKKYPFEHNWGYINYHKNFLKLNSKKKLLDVGKKLIEDRLLGNSKLSYLKSSPYLRIKNDEKLTKINLNNKKKNIIIFAHCFFDAVHRFRYSLYNDYYEQIKFFIKLSKKCKNFNWLVKQHPNDLKENDEVYKKLFKKEKNIVLLNKKTPNSLILKKIKPYIAITNNGSISHELAYHKIPVINTGDNVHINYKFNLNPKNKNQLLDMIINIKKYTKKLDFNKKNLYEFMYMHFQHPWEINQEKKLLKDNFFATKNFKFNSTDKIYKYYIKNHKKNISSIEKYIKIFLKNNKSKLNLNS